MTTTVGLIGSGMIGSAVARLAVDAGLRVILSNSRGPETLAELVGELGPNAQASTPQGAAMAGEIVVATIPLGSYQRLPSVALAGKTVIDTMNYYPGRDGRIDELDDQSLTSSALLQRYLADSRVVKAFNNIDFRRLCTLARPTGAQDRSGLPIAGDDAEARADVAALLDRLGYDAVDIGTLAESWRSEPDTPVYCQPYFSAQPPEGVTIEEAMQWFSDAPGDPVPAERIRQLTSDTSRGRPGGEWPASESQAISS